MDSDNCNDLFYVPKDTKHTNSKSWVFKEEEDPDTFDDLFYVPQDVNVNANTNTTGPFCTTYTAHTSSSTTTSTFAVASTSRNTLPTLISDEFDDLFVKPTSLSPSAPTSSSSASTSTSTSTLKHKQQTIPSDDLFVKPTLPSQPPVSALTSDDEFDNLFVKPTLPHTRTHPTPSSTSASTSKSANIQKPQIFSIVTHDDEFDDLFVKPAPHPPASASPLTSSSTSTSKSTFSVTTPDEYNDDFVKPGSSSKSTEHQEPNAALMPTITAERINGLSANPFFNMNFSSSTKKTKKTKTRKPLSLSLNPEDFDDLFVKPKPVFGPEPPPTTSTPTAVCKTTPKPQPCLPTSTRLPKPKPSIPIHPIFQNDHRTNPNDTYDPVCIILEDMNGTLDNNVFRDIYERRCWRISTWSEGEYHGLRLRDEVSESPDSKKQVFLEWEEDFKDGCVWIEMSGVGDGIQRVLKEYIPVVDENKYTWNTIEMATRRFTSFINHQIYTWRYHPPENLEMQWECVDEKGETVAYWSLKLPLEPPYFSSGRTLTILDGQEHLTLEMVTTCIIVRTFQDYYHELAEERHEAEEPGYKRRMKEEQEKVEEDERLAGLIEPKRGRWTPSTSGDSSSEDGDLDDVD